MVLTTIEPVSGRGEQSFDAYEYTVHSHTYNTDEIPSAKFSYDMSPIQVRLGLPILFYPYWEWQKSFVSHKFVLPLLLLVSVLAFAASVN